MNKLNAGGGSEALRGPPKMKLDPNIKTFPWLALILACQLCLALPVRYSAQRYLVLEHVTVIDATGAPARADMTVLIEGDRIASVGKSGTVIVPRSAQAVDASGKFLIPGLWDMHVHALQQDRVGPFFESFVANGVLGVRDMGSPLEELDSFGRWRSAVAEGKLLGPRFVAAGPIVDGRVPMFPEISVAASSEAEGRRTVDMLKSRGVDFVKVYSLLQRDVYFAIADEAKKDGLLLAGHVPDSVSALEASEAGQRSIEHLSGVLLACSSDEDSLRRYPILARTTGDPSVLYDALRRTRQRLWDTYDDRKAQMLFKCFVKNNTWQVPTLVVTWRMMSIVDAGTEQPDVLQPSLMSRQQREKDSWSGKLRGDYLSVAAGRSKRLFQLVAEMHRAGVQFMAGTDTPSPFVPPGSSLHDELAMFVKAGFTPMEALQSATINPARYLGLDERLGTVQEGKVADLVLLDANPLEDISNTRRICAVVLRGKLIHSFELEETAGDGRSR